MTLGELIGALEAEDSNLVLPDGFRSPHSYRGYYDQLAFEPAKDVKVGEALALAESALGATYGGWKGGDFTMDEHTEVNLAVFGECGEEIGPTLLRLMIEKAKGALDAG